MSTTSLTPPPHTNTPPPSYPGPHPRAPSPPHTVPGRRQRDSVSVQRHWDHSVLVGCDATPGGPLEESVPTMPWSWGGRREQIRVRGRLWCSWLLIQTPREGGSTLCLTANVHYCKSQDLTSTGTNSPRFAQGCVILVCVYGQPVVAIL